MEQKTTKNNIYIFYKIVCSDLSISDCYVGCTINFRTRKNSHKTKCNNTNGKHYNLYLYQFIREHGGWTQWQMIEINRHECIDKRDAHKLERYHIEQLNATLNKVIPTRTIKEYSK